MYFKVFIFMGYEQEHQQKPSPFSSAHKGKAQGLLIDIVAKMLPQRDLNVTSYYSAPIPSQISESISELHDVIQAMSILMMRI
ncbi:hypothetical protein [Staphylococcus equorum]|uniref:hypothetical protein n=1 Tax=Staphylococcus equorum TaxID=246432 RepID=UPI00086F3A94|nr:hypothetical protein [Staphylococcus equorum]OEL05672.1 hypothetical protein AST04_13950 [Staphylococcus equorum]